MTTPTTAPGFTLGSRDHLRAVWRAERRRLDNEAYERQLAQQQADYAEFLKRLVQLLDGAMPDSVDVAETYLLSNGFDLPAPHTLTVTLDGYISLQITYDRAVMTPLLAQWLDKHGAPHTHYPLTLLDLANAIARTEGWS